MKKFRIRKYFKYENHKLPRLWFVKKTKISAVKLRLFNSEIRRLNQYSFIFWGCDQVARLKTGIT